VSLVKASRIAADHSHLLLGGVDLAFECGEVAWAVSALKQMDVLCAIVRELADEVRQAERETVTALEVVGQLRLALDLVEAPYLDAHVVAEILRSIITSLGGRP
jgi:hypothetical protein